jgi:hypothetical protein
LRQKYCFGCKDFTNTTIILKRKKQQQQHSIYQVIFETFNSVGERKRTEKNCRQNVRNESTNPPTTGDFRRIRARVRLPNQASKKGKLATISRYNHY